MAAPQPALNSGARWRWPLLALCLLVFALLAAQVVLHGSLLAFDDGASRYWMAHRSPALTDVMRWVSILHEQLVVLVAAGLVALYLGARGDARSALAMLAVPVAMLLNVGVKHAFHRARPHWDDALVQLTSYSFPSGHAVASSVFWGMCCALVFAHTRSRWWRGAALAVAATMIVLVCFSRVVLGAHYPTDVAAGAALGLSCVLLSSRLLAR